LVGYGVVYGLVVVGIATALALRRPSRTEVGWFLTLHRVALTKRNGPMIVDYLARTRRWRVYGVVGSWAVAGSVGLVSPDAQPNGYAVLFGGWFIGGILAEVPVGPRRVGGVRVASLQPRTLSMYLSPGVTRWIGCWAGGTVGLLVLYGATVSSPVTRRVAVVLAVLAALTLLSVWSMRVIVRRPQPAAPPDVVAADDAIRRAAVRRIAAGWGVLQCMAAIAVARWLAAGSGSDVVAEIATAAEVVGAAGVAASWLIVPTRMSPTRARLDRLVAS
jgi:hypothetical protein